jgi:hypothetical protein
MADMVYAGIDVVLPVYWVSEPWWSQTGLENLARALEELRLTGVMPPSIAMFYDTGSLSGVDLRTEQGKSYLYDGIRLFYSTIPPEYWALAEQKRPIIWFWSAHLVAGYDQTFFDDLYQRFEQDFSVRPYLVFTTDWNCGVNSGPGQDPCGATYIWGGAISPAFTSSVAAVGPGYDDRGLPERSSPVHVDRRDGTIYRNGLVRAIRCGAPWLVIETWNEYHEGTDIAESVQYGRLYLDITREYAQYFKKGRLPQGISIETDFSKSSYVEIRLGSVNQENGLTLGPSLEDGQHQAVTADGIPARQTVAMNADAQAAYLYFHIDDGFYFDNTSNITISVEYLDEGFEPIFLDYDTAPCLSEWNASSMYKRIPLVYRSNSHSWRNARITISDARFGNHQNYNADFRLATGHTPLTVRYVKIDKAQ